MKLYNLDLGYRGSITVVAESMEKAIEYFKTRDEFQYQNPDCIVEHEIVSGLIIETYGDR
jgi:hypothetical protein